MVQISKLNILIKALEQHLEKVTLIKQGNKDVFLLEEPNTGQRESSL